MNYRSSIDSPQRWLMGILLALIVATVSLLIWQYQVHRSLSERASHYHLETMNRCIAISNELSAMERARSQLLAERQIRRRTGDSIGLPISLSRYHAAGFLIRDHAAAIGRLQTVYADAEFSFLVRRIEKLSEPLGSSLPSSVPPQDGEEDSELDTWQKRVRGLLLSAEQLRRLHRLHYKDLVATLNMKRQNAGHVLAVVIGSMLLLGAAAGRRLLRLNIDAKKRERRAYELLEERERLFRSTFEQAAVGILLVSPDGALLRVNQSFCYIVGYEREELMQLNFQQLTHDDDLESSLAAMDRLLAGELDTWSAEKRYIGKDGSVVWANLKVSLMRDPSGQPKYFISVVEEITTRKLMESERARFLSELEASNAELVRFAYTVSHDLKTPLVTIKGFLGLLESDIADGNADVVRRDVAQIRSAANKMWTLLNQLLELSRVGRESKPPESISLTKLAQQAVELVAGQIHESAVTIDIAPDLPEIQGDPVRLLEVFQNLIENAIKFIGDQPSPKVEIGMFEQGAHRVYYVRDNGRGIDPAHHERIFGLFNQLGTDVGGTGVGLALVQRIVEVHGGRVWVESEGAGLGSTFCFTLPQEDRAASTGPDTHRESDERNLTALEPQQ